METYSYFSVYLLMALLDIAACFADRREYGNERSGEKLLPWQHALVTAAAVLFSVAVTAANYGLFTKSEAENPLYSPLMLVYAGVVTALGVCAAREGLHYLALKALSARGNCRGCTGPVKVFWLCFAASLIVNAAVLFICYYPGVLSIDSIDQVSQILAGSYTNHHPYYHTQTIRLFLDMGMAIFGNINAGAALYSMAQIIVMALCFGYAAATVEEMGMPKWAVLATAAYFVLMPYNIRLGITMWKDIPFSLSVLAFITAAFRYLCRIGSRPRADVVIAAVSGLGICIMRGNGWLAFGASAAVFALLFLRREKGFALLLAAVLVVSFVMNHQVMDILGVKPTETVESLSVPIQQVARAVKDNEIGADEAELIGKIIDIEFIREYYDPGLADPVKFRIHEQGGEYLSEHMADYKSLYLRMAGEYPGSYIKAWIDETRGYWNGGYEYWRWYDRSIDGFGIEQSCRSEAIKTLLLWYCRAFSALPLLQPLLSIGLYTWITCTAALMAIIRKNREAFFVTMPVLAIIGTLLVATPVYAEFRYAYPMFCAMPVVVTAVFYEKRV